jgi:hypothetical protein
MKKLTIISAALALMSANFVGAAGPPIDVSRIIDKPAAESILGEKVKDPTPRNGDGKDGYYSKCNYYTQNRGKSLVLRVHLPAPDAMDPAQELELVAASSGPMKSIDGIGDKAEMFSGGGENGAGSRVLMLYVAKGNAFLTIGLGGFDDETVALDKAKTIAQKLIEHL